jgi:hypothetical protein
MWEFLAAENNKYLLRDTDAVGFKISLGRTGDVKLE